MMVTVFSMIGLIPTIGSFWLWAWPLILLPIVIHLLSRRRHLRVEWGAMMFLLNARKVNRGMAIVKHMAVLAMRMLAIAALIFAVSRPLATGWLGALAGSHAETVIVILDRSASMSQQDLATGETKLGTGLSKISNLLATLGNSQRVVLIESTKNRAIDIPSSQALAEYPSATPTQSSADVPAMLDTALRYIQDNACGRTDIWVCSDASANDWDPDSSRWGAFRDVCAEMDGVGLNVLNFNEAPVSNYAVTVERVERTKSAGGQQVELDIAIRRSADVTRRETVQVEIFLNSDSTKTVQEVTLEANEYRINGLRLQLEPGQEQGWGKVVLPTDGNLSDNVFYFCYSDLPTLKTTIVTDSVGVERALANASSTPMLRDREYDYQVIRPGHEIGIDWDETALILWQAELPQGETAQKLLDFVGQGRSVIFLPPRNVQSSTQFEGVAWGQWNDNSGDEEKITFWRTENDLLANRGYGKALSVDKVRVFRNCSLQGEARTLASFKNEDAFLVRKTTDVGGIYFLSTLPSAEYSTLAQDGEVIYLICQRAINEGSVSIGKSKQLLAGDLASQDVTDYELISGELGLLTEDRPYCSGVYSADDRLLALNRPSAEDSSKTLSAPEVEKLFGSLEFSLVNDQVGSNKSIVSEIWKWFVGAMGFALLIEVILCLPPKSEAKISEELAGGFKTERAR